MSNEPLGIFEELQRKRAIYEKHIDKVRHQCVKAGPASNGAYAQLKNPFDFQRRLRRVGDGRHSRWPNQRHGRVVYAESERGIGLVRVIQAVSVAADIPIETILDPGRLHDAAQARHIAIWLIDRYCPDYSFPEIAYLFDRDTNVVFYAFRVIDDRIKRHHKPTVELIARARQLLGD